MLSSVVRIGGPFPQAIQAVMGGALIAESFEAASRIAPTVPYPVATLEGDVFRGKHVVTGGDKTESRGILAHQARDQGAAREDRRRRGRRSIG